MMLYWYGQIYIENIHLQYIKGIPYIKGVT